MNLVEAVAHPTRSTAPLTVMEDVDGDSTRLIASGEVDLATAPVLRRALAGAVDSEPHNLILDLSRLDFLSAAGAVMIVTAVRSRRASSTIVVADHPATVRPLTLLGAGSDMRIFATLGQARSFLRAQEIAHVG